MATVPESAPDKTDRKQTPPAAPLSVDLSPERSVINRVIVILLFGLATGIAGSCLAIAMVEGITSLSALVFDAESGYSGFNPIILLAPCLGGLVVGGILWGLGSHRASGIADLIYQVQMRERSHPIRDALLHSLATVIGIGSGASVGHYGPVATMGAATGGSLGRWFRYDSALGIGCGVAAVISTAFSAPIAAIIFVHEVILRHYSLRAFAPITVASSTGFFINNYLLGRPPLFRISAERSLFAPELLAFVVIGICGALVAVLFMHAIMWSSALANRSKLPLWLRPAVAGLGVGVLAQWVPEILGLGKQVLTGAIEPGSYDLLQLAVMLVAKIVATAFCLGFGFAGGAFSPSLLIGVLTGALLGHGAMAIFGEASSGLAFYAICGMVAVTGPVIGGPLTAILIVFELTRNYELTTAVMISVVFSNVVAYRLFGRSLFDRQLALQGCDLSLGRDKLVLQQTTIATYVATDAIVLAQNQTLGEAQRMMLEAGRQECFVLNELSHYLGKIRLADIMSLARRVDIESTQVAEHADSTQIQLRHDTPVLEALALMQDFIGESIPIVDQRGYYLGAVYQSTLIAAYLKTIENLRAEEHAAA